METKAKMRAGRYKRSSSRGFSMIELMVVIVIISVVVGAILTQIEQVQQRSVAEQGKIDDFQQARDFYDQIYNDTRQMGFPNSRNIDYTSASWLSSWDTSNSVTTNSTNLAMDHRLAAGLIKLTGSQLEFQGDVDGTGNVSVVSYLVNGDGNCSTCLERSQVLKADGDPLTGQTNLTAGSYNVEVQNVQNTTSIFSAYDYQGNAITLPIDINANASTIPTVRTIEIRLSIASPAAVDPKTKQQLEADISGRVQVVNCSMASTVATVAAVNGIQLTCQ